MRKPGKSRSFFKISMLPGILSTVGLFCRIKNSSFPSEFNIFLQFRLPGFKMTGHPSLNEQ
jgi:hypothetical protein